MIREGVVLLGTGSLREFVESLGYDITIMPTVGELRDALIDAIDHGDVPTEKVAIAEKFVKLTKDY